MSINYNSVYIMRQTNARM